MDTSTMLDATKLSLVIGKLNLAIIVSNDCETIYYVRHLNLVVAKRARDKYNRISFRILLTCIWLSGYVTLTLFNVVWPFTQNMVSIDSHFGRSVTATDDQPFEILTAQFTKSIPRPIYLYKKTA